MKKVQVSKKEKVKDMKAVIPAGGEGSRLFPYTEIIPKALLPVGGRPVIWWIVQRLMRSGFEDVIVCVNQEYVNHFAHEFEHYPVRITIIQNEKPLGSAGEILGAKQDLSESFLVHYSDELTPINLVELAGFHKIRKGIGTLGVIKNVPLDVGILEVEKHRIKNIVEKPMLNQLAWAGIAVFEPEIFDYIKVGDDFARDIFPRLLQNKKSLYAYYSDVLWLDVGSLGHYRRACELARQGKL